MNRPKGRDKACNGADARARLDDARRFLEAADKLTEPGNAMSLQRMRSTPQSPRPTCSVASLLVVDPMTETIRPPSDSSPRSTRTTQANFDGHSITNNRPDTKRETPPIVTLLRV
jgi:hypothetical protein